MEMKVLLGSKKKLLQQNFCACSNKQEKQTSATS